MIYIYLLSWVGFGLIGYVPNTLLYNVGELKVFIIKILNSLNSLYSIYLYLHDQFKLLVTQNCCFQNYNILTNFPGIIIWTSLYSFKGCVTEHLGFGATRRNSEGASRATLIFLLWVGVRQGSALRPILFFSKICWVIFQIKLADMTTTDVYVITFGIAQKKYICSRYLRVLFL
jgi:hypothetical protein